MHCFSECIRWICGIYIDISLWSIYICIQYETCKHTLYLYYCALSTVSGVGWENLGKFFVAGKTTLLWVLFTHNCKIPRVKLSNKFTRKQLYKKPNPDEHLIKSKWKNIYSSFVILHYLFLGTLFQVATGGDTNLLTTIFSFRRLTIPIITLSVKHFPRTLE